MPRPEKQTVDYFPHVCSHGRTMFIIEERFGNDGYAFWFKLLELLGSTDGHFLDLADETTFEFLVSKTRVTPETVTGILDMLSKLGAIDPDLWSEQVVWIQKFVDGLAPLYVKRKTGKPVKPGFRHRKPVSTEVSDTGNPPEPEFAEVSDTGNPQTRVEESRVKKSRVKNPPTPLWLDQDAWIEFIEHRKSMKAKLTPHAQKILLNELYKLSGGNGSQRAIIEQSIANGWKGLFPLKGFHGRARPDVHAHNVQAIKEAFGEEVLDG